MADLDPLHDPDHRHEAIAGHQAGLLVSLAGPGTGKTYSFLNRIACLTADYDVPAASICYLTFIKEIARAFSAEYTDRFGLQPDRDLRPRISTLHSLACRLLRNRGFSLGYDGELFFASLADSDDPASAAFLQDLLPYMHNHGVTTLPHLRATVGLIKEAWRQNSDPASLGGAASRVLPHLLSLAAAYRLFDWDQAVPLAHILFLDGRNRQRWITQLEHYLIDEYQDFNPAEQAFLDALQRSARSAVIVGDDNQSIYSRRGAEPAALVRCAASPDADTVTLPICRRCHSNILAAANRFLLSFRPQARPLLPFHEGGDVACYRFKSAKAELDFLARRLQEYLGDLPQNPSPAHGAACLFPNRKALSFYFERLSQHVPAYTRRIQPLPDRLRLASHLHLVCNPWQRFSQRLLLREFTAIKRTHVQSMVALILGHDVSPADALINLAEGGNLPRPAAAAARHFNTYVHALSCGDAAVIAAALSDALGYDRSLLLDCTSDLLSQLLEQDQDDIINAFCDRVLPETAQPRDDPASVLFTTMHGAKGLTRRAVILPGLEAAWLPGQLTGQLFEESRRVFYVAITRATHHLLVTFPSTRARGDPLNFPFPGRSQPCPFVGAAGIPCSYHD